MENTARISDAVPVTLVIQLMMLWAAGFLHQTTAIRRNLAVPHLTFQEHGLFSESGGTVFRVTLTPSDTVSFPAGAERLFGSVKKHLENLRLGQGRAAGWRGRQGWREAAIQVHGCQRSSSAGRLPRAGRSEPRRSPQHFYLYKGQGSSWQAGGEKGTEADPGGQGRGAFPAAPDLLLQRWVKVAQRKRTSRPRDPGTSRLMSGPGSGSRLQDGGDLRAAVPSDRAELRSGHCFLGPHFQRDVGQPRTEVRCPANERQESESLGRQRKEVEGPFPFKMAPGLSHGGGIHL